MSVLDVIRARRARAAASAHVANVASCGNGFATPCNAHKSLIYKELSGRVANVADVARKIDEVEREAQTHPAPSVREAHEVYALHHWRCSTCCAAKQAAPEPEPPAPRPRLWWGQPASAEELERMAARVERAEAIGLSAREADAIADRLHLRDREGDDRRLCLECQHVRADREGWRCAAIRAPIPREWVATQLQRCPSFF
jgi:hypothetical protein